MVFPPERRTMDPVGPSDEVVMRHGLPAVLKAVAGLEREGILPPFFIDQMNALA